MSNRSTFSLNTFGVDTYESSRAASEKALFAFLEVTNWEECLLIAQDVAFDIVEESYEANLAGDVITRMFSVKITGRVKG